MSSYLQDTADCQLALETRIPAGAAITAAPASAALTSRLPSLDGWRALSILIVLGEHNIHTKAFPEEHRHLFTQLFDGQLGVRFFFMISGFLITWLMLGEEHRTGTVRLKNFYARRALRILPVYLVFLGVLAALQAFTPFHQSASAWFGNLTFTRNFFYDHFTSNHLWSLSVEEQFYLVWPALFIYAKPQSSLKKCLSLVVTTIVLAMSARYLFSLWDPASIDKMNRMQRAMIGPWSFFSNADTLAIGSVFAVLLARQRELISEFLSTRPLLVPGCGLFLLFTPVLLHLEILQTIPDFDHLCQKVDVVTGRSLQSLGFALLMMQSVVVPRLPIYRILNLRPVMQLGVLSYSIYIWQQLFCTKPENYGIPDAWWNTYPLWLAPALLVAVVSYYGLERPLLNLRHRFR
ncbi:MAG: acyltransferase [Prosthecobacter sp.]|uniref:acyltransferase family protein n=1 Tax=Prosthecobacter sp. TaxID=1965333 RepID=UPI003BB001A3